MFDCTKCKKFLTFGFVHIKYKLILSLSRTLCNKNLIVGRFCWSWITKATTKAIILIFTLGLWLYFCTGCTVYTDRLATVRSTTVFSFSIQAEHSCTVWTLPHHTSFPVHYVLSFTSKLLYSCTALLTLGVRVGWEHWHLGIKLTFNIFVIL